MPFKKVPHQFSCRSPLGTGRLGSFCVIIVFTSGCHVCWAISRSFSTYAKLLSFKELRGVIGHILPAQLPSFRASPVISLLLVITLFCLHRCLQQSPPLVQMPLCFSVLFWPLSLNVQSKHFMLFSCELTTSSGLGHFLSYFDFCLVACLICSISLVLHSWHHT